MENYFLEAFNRLSLVESDFNMDVEDDKNDLKSYVSDDTDDVSGFDENEYITDVEAKDENDLQDTYEGKAILRCSCCWGEIFKDKDEVVIDKETNLANMEEVCPICNQALGFYVVGKIVPLEGESKQADDEPEDQTDEKIDIEATEESEEPKAGESLADRVKRKHLVKESLTGEQVWDKIVAAMNRLSGGEEEVGESVVYDYARDRKKACNEAIDFNATGEDDVHVTKEDDGSIDIKIGAGADADMDIMSEPASSEFGEETVAPFSDEEKEEIKDNTGDEEEPESNDVFDLGFEPEEANTDEAEPVADETEEEPVEDEESEDEEKQESFNYVDESRLDTLVESYLKRVYGNVAGYFTTDISESVDSLIVNGQIKYNSGATRDTQFVFESARFNSRGGVILEGYNNTFSNNKEAFTVRGSYKNKEMIPESLTYDYSVNQLNESGNNETIFVRGRVKTNF